ncbi:MAG: GNAT family N-acetyltransferase [Bacteriovoracaceae bacterium]|jgi:ribosomal protein S18 acetylase RimI-like enzyme|nr:GNAT family N-acetyltransferase [Bacteriovoracaceae bacterium]
MNFEIRSLNEDLLEDVRLFTDQWIGKDYFSPEELQLIFKRSIKNEVSASLVAFHKSELVAVRLTYAPDQWIEESTRGLTPKRWDVPVEKVAYFKSLFVRGDFQQQGLGKTLSNKSIQILEKMGAEAILCHSWLESPGNSSQKYLQKIGFNDVSIHEKFWFPVDYHCRRCGPNKCVCTTVEMIKKI